MRDRFTDGGQTIKKPDCKGCKYSINEGIDGCKLDKQTLKIKVGMEKCKDREEEAYDKYTKTSKNWKY